jgi:hypothetical protein
MLVIIITIITQGVRVPADLKGHVQGSLFVNDGFFQAIGVISFGNNSMPLSRHTLIIIQRLCVVCFPLQQR